MSNELDHPCGRCGYVDCHCRGQIELAGDDVDASRYTWAGLSIAETRRRMFAAEKRVRELERELANRPQETIDVVLGDAY